MALAEAGGLATFDLSATESLDLSDVLATILLADNFLLGKLPMSGQATQTTHSWHEDALNATTVTQSAADTALDASDTSLVLTAASSVAVVGALLKDIAAGKSEIVQVTAVSGATLTITRGYGSTSGEAHDASAQFRVISVPRQENNQTVNDISKARTRRSNYTQIFQKEVELSNTKIATQQAGVANELSYQIANRTLELHRELGMSAYHSVKSADSGSDSSLRSFGGIREWLTLSGSNSNTSAEALDEKVFNAMYRQCWDDGAMPYLAAGSADQITKFALIHNDKIRIAPSERIRGTFVERFLTDLGQEVELLADRWIQSDELVLLDTGRIAVMPLVGRAWQMNPLGVTGDGKKLQMIGEYTMECRNPTEAHAIHTNLTV